MRRWFSLGCAIVLAGILTTGCGSNKSSSQSMYDAVSNEMAIAETTMAAVESKGEMEYEEGLGDGTAVNEEVDFTGRKLIKTVSMDVETEEFDELVAKLLSRVSGLGGYVENSSTNNPSSYVNRGRSANYMIRVPSERLDELVGNVTELANVTWKEENVQDITLHYVDVESHKIALQTEQDRLLVLMEQAESVEDLIAIEERLSEIRYQIQNYESTLRTYDNQVNYSTLHLAIAEVKKLTPQEEPGVWERIREGFSENLERVMVGTRDFLIGVIVDIPYLVIWGVVLFLGFLIGKKVVKKKGFWSFKKFRSKGKKDSEEK